MPRTNKREALERQPRMDLAWIGILMIAFSILYTLSLFTYNTLDPPLNPNSVSFQENGYHNMIGPVGAYLSYSSFMLVGFAAFMVPLLLLFFGLAFLHPFFAYLRQSWREPTAATVYLFSLMGLLQVLYMKFNLRFFFGRRI